MAKLTKASINRHRKNLLQILERLGVKLEHMEDMVLRTDGETSPDEVDEFGSDSYHQEFQLGLIENEDEILREVEDALTRMDRGEYGTCENCEGPIPPRRLEVRPYARFCLPCQQKSENGDLSDD